jgi:hypothetical protein
MQYPTLDEKTQAEIEGLDEKGLGGLLSLRSYGMDAVVHTVIMKAATSLRKRELKDFLERYGIILGGIRYGNLSQDTRLYSRTKEIAEEGRGIVVLRRSIEKDGVYVLPYHRECLLFFDGDIVNAFYDPSKGNFVQPGEVSQILSFEQVHWFPELLLCRPLMQRGVRLGQFLWEVSVRSYRSLESSPQPENVTQLGERIIAYYSSIIYQK